MRVLYHLWLSPFARKVRLVLGEKKLDFSLEIEKVWERRGAFLTLNPAGDVPVLVDEDGLTLADSVAISEYLDERYPEPPLMGRDIALRAEARRLVSWFDSKLWQEVTRNLVDEKVYKRAMGLGEPDSGAIRAGTANIHHHLEYIGYLIDRRRWLAGDALTLADMAAAAQLSCLDYLGDVPWDAHGAAKDWYARIKSRPSFRPLLNDYVPGLPPPPHYANLDF